MHVEPFAWVTVTVLLSVPLLVFAVRDVLQPRGKLRIQCAALLAALLLGVWLALSWPTYGVAFSSVSMLRLAVSVLVVVSFAGTFMAVMADTGDGAGRWSRLTLYLLLVLDALSLLILAAIG